MDSKELKTKEEIFDEVLGHLSVYSKADILKAIEAAQFQQPTPDIMGKVDGERELPTSKLSNSQVGSSHWYITLQGATKRIGEYLLLHGTEGIDNDILKSWGKQLYEIAQEQIEWSEPTPATTTNR